MANNDTDVQQDTSVQDSGADTSSVAEHNESVTTDSSLMEAMKADPELNGNANGTDEAEDQQTEDEPEAPAEAATETPDEEAETTEDEPDSRLSEKTQRRMRGLVAEKRALEEQVAQLQSQVNRPHTVDDYVEAGYSEAQAEAAQIREELAVERENNRIAKLNADLYEMSREAEHDFPVYDEKSPDYDEEFTNQVAAAYRKQANLQLSPDGQYILRADIPIYDFYQNAANWRDGGYTRGRKSGSQDTAKQYASAESAPSSRPPAKSSQDSELDLMMKGLRSKLPNN